uniref:Uncharacterized protein n=1 Tax=Human herpesvirus 2 TaxID=10310 RepID=A0A481T4P5_HHV2|nr:hypothetical protein [Human alphaherpesvirus 2]
MKQIQLPRNTKAMMDAGMAIWITWATVSLCLDSLADRVELGGALSPLAGAGAGVPVSPGAGVGSRGEDGDVVVRGGVGREAPGVYTLEGPRRGAEKGSCAGSQEP